MKLPTKEAGRPGTALQDLNPGNRTHSASWVVMGHELLPTQVRTGFERWASGKDKGKAATGLLSGEVSARENHPEHGTQNTSHLT